MSNQDRADGVIVYSGTQTPGAIVTDETGRTTGLVLYIDNPTDGGPVTRQGAYDHCMRCFIDSTTSMRIEPDRWQFRPTPQAPGADTPGGRGEVACWRMHFYGSPGQWLDVKLNGKPWRTDQLRAGVTVELAYTHPAESSGGDAVDAARYRWLRDNSEVDSTYNDVIGMKFPCPPELDGFDTIDQAIDAAIASGAEHER